MRRSHHGLVVLLVVLVLAAPEATPAQEPCGDRWIEVDELSGPYRDFARAAELMGRAPVQSDLVRRSASERVLAMCGEPHPWERRTEATSGDSAANVSPWWPEIRMLAFRSSHRYNTAYPSDHHNGAVWAGRGLSSTVSGGAHLRWGPLSAQLAPMIAYQQNRSFRVQPARIDDERFSRFLYSSQPGLIDWPQRLGEDPFWEVHPGQSYVRVDAYGIAVGLSTENQWWGPALEQPILLGSSAPGFPHAFLGTSTPVGIGIGRLSIETFWGRLTESEFFDTDPDNDHRLFAGLSLVFEPSGVEGLYFGLARTYMRPLKPDGLPPLDYLAAPYDALLKNREDDNEMFGVFARWAFPRSGFEVFGEWVREDHWADIDDLIAEPEHTLGYTVGLQKVGSLGSDWMRAYGELFRVDISSEAHRSGRGVATFFTHNRVIHGYTHQGQLLGASTGPGSGGERVGADLFTSQGLIGLFVARTSYDDDAYYSRHLIQGRTRGDNRDVEWTAGIRQLLFIGDFDVTWTAAWSHRTNRSFIGLFQEGDGNFPEQNWRLGIGGAWRPGYGIR